MVPDLKPLDFFLSGCEKGQMYSQRIDKLKIWIAAATSDVTKITLRYIWQEVIIGVMYAEQQMVRILKRFALNNFSVCVKMLF
jgi:hypothetical protein